MKGYYNFHVYRKSTKLTLPWTSKTPISQNSTNEIQFMTIELIKLIKLWLRNPSNKRVVYEGWLHIWQCNLLVSKGQRLGNQSFIIPTEFSNLLKYSNVNTVELNSIKFQGISVIKVEPYTAFWIKHRFFFKFLISNFNALLNIYHQVYQKNLMNGFRKKFQIKWFWAQKWSVSPILGTIKIFVKIKKGHSYSLFNAFHRVQFQNFNLMNRFKENFKNLDFGRRNPPFNPFWTYKDFS